MKKLLPSIFSLLMAFSVLGDNNFSQRLLEGKPGVFSNPRAGWVWIQADKSGEFELGGKKFTLTRGEGFVELPAGQYDLSGFPWKTVCVHAVPELLFYKFVGNVNAPAEVPYELAVQSRHGRDGMFLYNWNYLREKILDNFNAVMTFSTAPEILRWRAEGRKTVCEGPVTVRPESRESVWRERLNRYPYGGILLDEFIIPVPPGSPNSVEFGYTNPGLGLDAQTLQVVRKLNTELTPRSARLYCWFGVPWRCHGRDIKPLAEAVKSSGGRLVWEAYCFSRNWENELKRRFGRIHEFLEADRDFMHYTLVAPSTMEFSDNNSAVDFKVFLDKQFFRMANDPSFTGIAGISFWGSTSTKPEILRYFSALVRHYCILGEKTSLADRLGFKIEPGILANPEWTDGTSRWRETPAVAGSIRTVACKDWPEHGFKAGYFPRAPHALLSMKYVPEKSNVIRQTLENLVPGRLYALTALTTAVRPDSRLELFAADIGLTHCKVLEVLLRPIRDYTPGKNTNRLCWNNYEIIFRYEGPLPAELILSDRASPSGTLSGKNSVQADILYWDGIRIAPYFAENMESATPQH